MPEATLHSTSALARLNDLHHFYDGAIPKHERDVARLGSSLMVELVAAEGQVGFFTTMARGQLVAIRKRRADGSFYPSLIADLNLYRRERRRWREIARELQAQFDARVAEISAAQAA